MERIVIVGYKPFKGKETELKKLSKSHWNTLYNLGFVTERKPIVMKADGGIIVEVFGWKSKKIMEEAHSNPEILKMWTEYSKICEYIPIGNVKEANNLFSEFTPIDI